MQSSPQLYIGIGTIEFVTCVTEIAWQENIIFFYVLSGSFYIIVKTVSCGVFIWFLQEL